MGATITVPMWRFISSGEMIRQGRVFRISCPSVGSRRIRKTSKRDATTSSLSDPIRGGWRITINEGVISFVVHLLKGLFPPSSCFGSGPNDQLSLLHDKVHGSVQLTLFNYRFGNSDPSGISDSYHLRLHIDVSYPC